MFGMAINLFKMPGFRKLGLESLKGVGYRIMSLLIKWDCGTDI